MKLKLIGFVKCYRILLLFVAVKLIIQFEVPDSGL